MTWPDLPYDTWAETATTLQLWMQIVGKIRLVQTPWINHAWHVPLYLNGRGLTTSLISHGADFLEISFDFIDQQLVIQSSRNNHRCQVPLRPCSVAAFYADVDAGLRSIGDPIAINTVPCEMSEAIPFERDSRHRDYDGEAAARFCRILLQVQRVFQEFRARFIGKCSPIHFFWGSFDLADTRFSGRMAPEHPGGVPHLSDWVTRELLPRSEQCWVLARRRWLHRSGLLRLCLSHATWVFSPQRGSGPGVLA